MANKLFKKSTPEPTPTVTLHLLKFQSPKGVEVKCGAKVSKDETTAWTNDVTCEVCRVRT